MFFSCCALYAKPSIQPSSSVLSSTLKTSVSSTKKTGHTISGLIKMWDSGETVISATVYDTLSHNGALSNSFGLYSLTLADGPVVLRFSFVGYQTQYVTIDLSKDTTYNVHLKASTELQEVVVLASRNEMGVQGSQMSAIEVPVKSIVNMPALAGEVDVIKALQLLPGVQSGSEGSVGLYVRGGGPEENLILLDGIPLYSINHLFGFFSVFNVDAIKNVTLYKGSFPAQFGSRLSSVVDVRQKDGNDQTYHGSVSLGIISAKVNFEGPLKNKQTTFNVSFRRTYIDALAKMAQTMQSLDQSGGYYFYDLNGKLTHRFSDQDILSLTLYKGNDNINVDVDAYENNQTMDMTWGNTLGILNWFHIITPKLFVNTSVALTQYKYDLDLRVDETYTVDEAYSTPEEDPLDIHNKIHLGMYSMIDDQSINTAFEYHPSIDHDINFGMNYIYHTFKPSVTSFKQQSSSSNLDTALGDVPAYRHELAFYIQDNWQMTSYLKTNIGLRSTFYNTSSLWFSSLEPRLSMCLRFTPRFSVKASYSVMSQYIHLLSNSSLSLPTDLWVPVTDKIKPMNSHQLALGAFYHLPHHINLSIEGYYKTTSNNIAYKDGASFMGSTENWEEKVVMGRGWSYGVEFLAQKTMGAWTGWLGYTWSVAQRKFDRAGQMINQGKAFYAKYDRRHDLSLTMAYSINTRWTFSSTFTYGTGQRGTLGLESYYMYSDPYNAVVPIDERNNFELPAYHRLDVSASYHKKIKAMEHIWVFSIYNVYNHQNPYMVYIEDEYNKDHSSLKQISLFPIIPSVSYTLKF